MAEPEKSATYFLTAANVIMEERAKERDVQQERSMTRIVDTFNTLVGGDKRLTVEEGWLFMVILKLVRFRVKSNEDSMLDALAYLSLMAEESFSDNPLSDSAESV